jgi:hypothetical protein
LITRKALDGLATARMKNKNISRRAIPARPP